jgi:hypothetical protein
MSKVFNVEVKVRLRVELRDDVNISDALTEMTYAFKLDPDHGEVIDEEIRDYEEKP